jgi:hypothetical protein
MALTILIMFARLMGVLTILISRDAVPRIVALFAELGIATKALEEIDVVAWIISKNSAP